MINILRVQLSNTLLLHNLNFRRNNILFIVSELLKLVHKVVPYDMLHNSETDAADLLMEIERLDLLVKAVDSKTYRKVAHYLKSCVPYAPGTEITLKRVDYNRKIV